MNFDWLKRFMPRGLYGRAALILFLPVVVVTVVVTVMFLQRHFEDVTRQMTGGMTGEIGLVAARIEAAPDLAAARARQGAGVRSDSTGHRSSGANASAVGAPRRRDVG